MKQSTKPRFVAYAAVTLDGRISLNPKKLPDWTSDEDWAFLQKELATCDAFVVGRNTYLAAKKSLDKRGAIIFTSRVASTREVKEHIWVNPQKADLKKLFAQYKKVAILGGAQVYDTMLTKKLVDDFYITIEPLIFGRGQPLVIGKSTTQLTLVSSKKLNTRGTLLLHYTLGR